MSVLLPSPKPQHPEGKHRMNAIGCVRKIVGYHHLMTRARGTLRKAFPGVGLVHSHCWKARWDNRVMDMDQLLLPYLQATDDSDRQRHLSETLSAYAVPEVRLALRQRLSFFVDSRGKSPHNQDAEDLFQEIMTKIVQALHDLRKPSATAVIEDLEEYIARIATNSCNDVLRSKTPSRTRLKYNLRFVLTHHEDFSIWKSDRLTLTGFAEWRHEGMSPSNVTLSVDSEHTLA